VVKKAEHEKKVEEEREMEEQVLADKNWKSLKPLLLNSLEEINKEVLKGKGLISVWEKVDDIHYHEYVWVTKDKEEVSEINPHYFNAEYLEMTLPDIGVILISRNFKSSRAKPLITDDLCDEKVDSKKVDILAYSKYPISGLFKEEELINEYCGPCYFSRDAQSIPLVFNSKELENNINKAEDIILDKIIALHKKSLLDSH
ncbi:MAG: hypothetical protein ACYDIA_17305, partial [Candidatus Humimicrobiaceae bacterium]